MRNCCPGFTWPRFCASAGTLSVATPPFGPRKVTVRACASTLVTVTTASTSPPATAASFSWALHTGTTARLQTSAVMAVAFMNISLELGSEIEAVLDDVRRTVGAAEVDVLRVDQK